MRAIVSTGKSKRVVDLPTWVEVRTSPTSVCAWCLRCRARLDFYGPKQEDERALGRFVLWHRKCTDPALVRAAVEAAERAKKRRGASSSGRGSDEVLWGRVGVIADADQTRRDAASRSRGA